MPVEPGENVLQQFQRAALRQDGLDAELLEQFLAADDGDAFAALVRRHGPMVLGVCRRLLHHQQDAEDAFQAAFLVLARKAGSVRKREALGNWLYGVAHRTALEARAASAHRGRMERQVSPMPEPAIESAEAADGLLPVLDAELSRLPEKYRAALVLCHLEGLSRRLAAKELCIPEGTLSSRLAMGRRLLAERLKRRGVTLSAAALAAALAAQTAPAAVPASLIRPAALHALAVRAGKAAASGVVSENVLVLTERVGRTMLASRVKTVLALLVAAGLAVAGAAGLAYSAWAGGKPAAEQAASAPLPRNGEKLQALLKERRDFARTQYGLWKKGALESKDIWDRSVQSVGPGGTGDRNRIVELQLHEMTASRAQGQLYQWALRLLAAELDMSETKAEGLAVHEAHLARMKELQDSYKKRARREADEYAATAEFHRLDAEVQLERARSR